MAEIPTHGFNNAPYTDPAQQEQRYVALDSYYDITDGVTPIAPSEAVDQISRNIATSIDYHRAAAQAASDVQHSRSIDGVNYARDEHNNFGAARHEQNEVLQDSLDPPLKNAEAEAPLPPLGEAEVKAFEDFLTNVMRSADKRTAFNRSDQGYSGLSADAYWSQGKPVYQVNQKTGEQVRDAAGKRIEIHRSTPRREILAGMLARYMDQHPQYAHIVQTRVAALSKNVVTTTQYKDAAVSTLDGARSRVAGIQAEQAAAPKPIKEVPLDPAHNPNDPAAQAKLAKTRATLTAERDKASYAGDTATATAKDAELARLDDADTQYALDQRRYQSWHNRAPNIKWLGPASLADTRPRRRKQDELIADRGAVIGHNNYIKDLPGRIAKAQLVAEGYAAPALERAEYLQTEDEFRLECLQNVFEDALERNKKDTDLNPAEIKAIISNIDDIEQDSAAALVHMFSDMRLHNAYDTDSEHITVESTTTLQGYLDTIDPNLNRYFVDSDEYQEISSMRAEVLGEYIAIRYRREVVRAFQANLTGDFAGRYATHFIEDGGVEVEDGTGMVLYPDQSYGIRLPGALVVDRRNADGTPWDAARSAASETVVAQPDPAVLELATQDDINAQFETAVEFWFLDQGSSSSEAARTLAEAALAHARADLESNIQNPTAHGAVNYYTYWSSFLATSARGGSAGNLPHRYSNGSVEMRGTLPSIYANEWVHGRWEVRPDGNRRLLAQETAPALPPEPVAEQARQPRLRRLRRALGRLTNKGEVQMSASEEVAALDELLEEYDPKPKPQPK